MEAGVIPKLGARERTALAPVCQPVARILDVWYARERELRGRDRPETRRGWGDAGIRKTAAATTLAL